MSLYTQLKTQLKNATPTQSVTLSNEYSGNTDPILGLNVPTIRKISKEFMAQHSKMSIKEFTEIADQLISGDYAEEKYIIGYLLGRSKRLRAELPLENIYNWVEHMQGWQQIDSLCQSLFEKKEIDPRWDEWRSLLIKLNGSDRISHRRASLVLLVRPVRDAGSEDYAALAAELMENLLDETDILITKAISWLLREMVKQHRELVADFLTKHHHKLPNFVIKEVTTKLRTGKKNA